MGATGTRGVRIFISGKDIRLFISNNHITVAGLMFPGRPCGSLHFCDGKKRVGVSGFAVCGLNLWAGCGTVGDGGGLCTGLVPIVLYFFTVKFMSLIKVTSGCMGTSLSLASSRTGVFPSLIFF